MKYNVKFVAKAYCFKTIDIQDESDPYKEARELGESLTTEDMTVDFDYLEIDKLRPQKEPNPLKGNEIK